MNDRSNEVTAVTGGGPAPPDDSLAPGTIVGEFRIERTLGRGGMGNVYGAVHTVIGKRGAVKVLRHDLCTDQGEVGRFIQEARAVNQIGHANIVDVFAFGSLPDGRSYLVMEWLSGESLRDRMRRGPLSRSQIYDLISDVVNALEAAHRASIVHRDLKPDNVFLVEMQGDRRRAKLLDFGVAKLTAEGKAGWTRMGALIGTPQYIAPEQARGEATYHSDIYALGIMLFELLAGRPPFTAPNMVEILSMHMMEPAPRLSSFVDVPKELDDLVDAMLAKDGEERPTLATIRSGLEQLVPARALATGIRTLKVPKQRRSRLPFVLGAILVAGVAAGAFAVVRGMSEEPAAEPIAIAKPPAPAAPAPPPKPAPPPPKAAPPPPTPVPPPRQQQGTLWVVVKRSNGVEIEIAGIRSKPNQAVELAAGAHELAVLRNGKQIGQQIINIKPGNQTKIEVKVPPAVTTSRPPDIDDGLRAPSR